MNNILVRCPHCNTIFRVTRSKNIEGKNIFITDLNGLLVPEDYLNYHCLHCKKLFDLANNSILTEDWIAQLIFKIKGK